MVNFDDLTGDAPILFNSTDFFSSIIANGIPVIPELIAVIATIPGNIKDTFISEPRIASMITGKAKVKNGPKNDFI